MKKFTAALLLTPLFTLSAMAGTPIPLADVPEAVNKTINDYFPGSSPLSAEKDDHRGSPGFEVVIQYKEIKLEVSVSPEGKLLEVDSQN